VKPINFNAEMVRAILEGRKSQSRRPVKGVPGGTVKVSTRITTSVISRIKYMFWAENEWLNTEKSCPYGKVGDRLWVRETWQGIYSSEDPETGFVDEVMEACLDTVKEHRSKWAGSYYQVAYSADGWDAEDAEERGFKWRSPVTMPQWASRITLEITGVRVERIQNVTDAKVRAEGVLPVHHLDSVDYFPGFATRMVELPVEVFPGKWDAIYEAKGFGWDANPWVWVIEFERPGNEPT